MSRKLRRIIFVSLLYAAVACANCAAEETLKPNRMFSDNAVLQQDMTIPVWGTAKPGAKVNVSINGKSASATTDSEGRWLVKLPPMKTGGPFTMTIESGETITLKNIMVGEVWVCSGQSNMQMGIGVSKDAKKEVAAANWPNIRLYTIPRNTSDTPLEAAKGKWDVCTPETIAGDGWGGFTAAGYYFGRKIHKELKVPVGLIHTSWGGTVAEAWTELGYLEKDEELKPIVERWRTQMKNRMNDAEKQKIKAEFKKTLARWNEARKHVASYAQHPDTGDKGLAKGFAKNDFDDSSWQEMTVPLQWEKQGGKHPKLIYLDGAIWFRKSVEVPAEAAGKDLELSLGPIDDFDTTYFNGEKVGSTGIDTPSFWVYPRVYKIPGKLVKAGKNTIAVRIFDHMGGGGFTGSPKLVNLSLPGGKKISLAGMWKFKISLPLDPMILKNARKPRLPGERPQNYPAHLYNAMVVPVAPYATRGAIWYQGESNSGRGWQYRTLLPVMIESWRKLWNQNEFAFHIVQLANYKEAAVKPGDDAWAELREAQYLTAKNDGQNGLAVAIDIGDAKDIHPKNKQEVGRRLALAALAITYDQKIECSGPEYKSMKVEGDKIRVSFDHATGGLTAKGGELQRFAICGADKKFVWAQAKIDGNTVVVSSPKVTAPVAVRYAWNINPEGCNLYNGEGLPCIPFRTDDFPVSTQKSR